MLTRRQLLSTTGIALGTVSVGGCTGTRGSADGPAGTDAQKDADIVAGPDNELAFRPDSLTVSVDDEVTWYFATPNHNVSCNPTHSAEAELPAAAAPFASYDGDDKHRTEPQGATFSHTFSTPGNHVYVCIPHIPNGMIGTITVTE